jgi:hypothetical protein
MTTIRSGATAVAPESQAALEAARLQVFSPGALQAQGTAD